ncbi:MAG TPA: hypothetical protein VMR25_14635 [Planctomycetaceae bacterium]|nr:hypothetical protein [Planctomycetaceae bacterium]
MAALDLEIDDEPPEARLMVVSGITPIREIVIADAAWVRALAQLEERVMAHKVVDAATQQVASDLLRRLTTAGTLLEDARKKVKEPFLDMGRKIDEIAVGPRTRIEAAKKRLQGGINAFAEAEAARVRQAEVDRQVKLRLLEIEAQKERDRLKLIADEAAAMARAALAAHEANKVPDALGIEEDEPEAPVEPPAPPQKSEAEIRLEQAKHAPVPVVAKAAGLVMRVTLDIASVDADKLPAPFVQRVPLMGLLRSTFCTAWVDGSPIPECPGVAFERKSTPVSGRQRI